MQNRYKVDRELPPPAHRELVEELLAQLDGEAGEVVLELDDLARLDAPVIRQLVTILRRVRERGGDVALSVSKPDLLRTLRITALDKVFRIDNPSASAA
ncbi:MAG: STAS domain-containing protein [Candidatus Eremiobacteraeota bacterium]|nr:STAS domain-containing protein [Candidatus Eremiobacteraeota bacterium]